MGIFFVTSFNGDLGGEGINEVFFIFESFGDTELSLYKEGAGNIPIYPEIVDKFVLLISCKVRKHGFVQWVTQFGTPIYIRIF